MGRHSTRYGIPKIDAQISCCDGQTLKMTAHPERRQYERLGQFGVAFDLFAVVWSVHMPYALLTGAYEPRARARDMQHVTLPVAAAAVTYDGLWALLSLISFLSDCGRGNLALC